MRTSMGEPFGENWLEKMKKIDQCFARYFKSY